MANEKRNHPRPSACVPQASATSAGGAAATFTFADPGDGYSIVVGSVSWSYDTTPTGGAITVSDGTTSISHKVSAAGPNSITFNPPLLFADTTAVTVVAAAGGGAVIATAHGCGYKQLAGQTE